jgi:hypothetical protein
MKRSWLFLAVVVASFGFSGCGMKADMKTVDAAVEKFHAQLNAGNFDQIYADTNEALKQASSREEFVKLLGAVHRKLGAVKSSSRGNFFENWGTSGKIVRTSYPTEFEGDSAAQEEFVFQVGGDGATIRGYHINSNALITQ